MNLKKKNLLIIGSSQGYYGGIEAFMVTLAEEASKWPEFNVRLCFKLVKGANVHHNLKLIAENTSVSIDYVKRGSIKLLKLIVWSDILHVQNTPPDIVFPAYILRKRIFLTIHNKRVKTFNFHSVIWGISMKLADCRWYNSKFVWYTWEPDRKLNNSSCVPTVCRLPDKWCPVEDRKGFLFVGRWIENKGIEEILKAYALNNFSYTEQPLTLVGDGPLKEKVFALIKELKIAHVVTPGFLDNETKANYISSSRWILAPANTLEDLGLTPIEGRSVGVPSIVSRDGGLLEAGGEAALVVKPGDVEDLAKYMKIAAEMDLITYRNKSEIAYTSLSGFLKPMGFYKNAFLN